MRLYHRIIAGGLVIAGLAAALLGWDEKKEWDVNSPTSAIVRQEELVSGNGINPPRAVNIESTYGSKVGRTARLYVGALDNTGIEKAILYEDGEPVRQLDNFVALDLVDIVKTQPERHTYQFEVEDEDGNRVRSVPITLAFSANMEDRVPHSVAVRSEYDSKVGRTARLYIRALDFGDNAGIAEATLYEDGKPFKKLRDFVAVDLIDIVKTQPGEHTYRFEVVDRGGHSAKSPPIKVSFSP